LEQLRANFLREKFFGTLMLPGNSLYDLAGAVFPSSRLMLREHFRCVEPIIRFSMQFYTAPDGDDPLYPVRVPKPSERLDPPLVAIHVPHGEKSRSQTNQRWSPFPGQFDKLGSPRWKDEPDDGKAEALFGGVQGEGGLGGDSW
jgi:hypothetical protein